MINMVTTGNRYHKKIGLNWKITKKTTTNKYISRKKQIYGFKKKRKTKLAKEKWIEGWRWQVHIKFEKAFSWLHLW